MKTTIKTFALLVTLAIISSVNVYATAFNFSEETYISDIPFNTENIINSCLYTNAISQSFQLDEEEYVDDIPFDTKTISDSSKYQKAIMVEFNFEDEEFIEDIK